MEAADATPPSAELPATPPLGRQREDDESSCSSESDQLAISVTSPTAASQPVAARASEVALSSHPVAASSTTVSSGGRFGFALASSAITPGSSSAAAVASAATAATTMAATVMVPSPSHAATSGALTPGLTRWQLASGGDLSPAAGAAGSLRPRSNSAPATDLIINASTAAVGGLASAMTVQQPSPSSSSSVLARSGRSPSISSSAGASSAVAAAVAAGTVAHMSLIGLQARALPSAVLLGSTSTDGTAPTPISPYAIPSEPSPTSSAASPAASTPTAAATVSSPPSESAFSSLLKRAEAALARASFSSQPPLDAAATAAAAAAATFEKQRKKEKEDARRLDGERAKHLAKWRALLDQWEAASTPAARPSRATVLSLCWSAQGVPPVCRSRLWQLASGNDLGITPADWTRVQAQARAVRDEMQRREEKAAGEPIEKAGARGGRVERAIQADAAAAAAAASSSASSSSILTPSPLFGSTSSTTSSSTSASTSASSSASTASTVDVCGDFLALRKDVPRTFAELTFFHIASTISSPMVVVREEDHLSGQGEEQLGGEPGAGSGGDSSDSVSVSSRRSVVSPASEVSEYALGLVAVLEGFVCFRPTVGFVQGQSYLAATLLLHMDADPFRAFVVLANLLAQGGYARLFRMEARSLRVFFRAYASLLASRLPTVARHFTQCVSPPISPDLYLVEWLLTAFARSLPLELTARLWDLWLVSGAAESSDGSHASNEYRGVAFLIQASLGLLKFLERHCHLVTSAGGEPAPFESTVEVLMRPPHGVLTARLDEVLATIRAIRVTHGDFEQRIREAESQLEEEEQDVSALAARDFE